MEKRDRTSSNTNSFRVTITHEPNASSANNPPEAERNSPEAERNLLVNPFNVARLLLEWYKTPGLVRSPVTLEELVLRDQIRVLIDAHLRTVSPPPLAVADLEPPPPLAVADLESPPPLAIAEGSPAPPRRHTLIVRDFTDEGGPSTSERSALSSEEEDESSADDKSVNESSDRSYSPEKNETKNQKTKNEITKNETKNKNVKNKKSAGVDFEYKKKAVAFWLSGKTKKRTFKSVQQQFRKVSDVRVLYVWKKQLNASLTDDTLCPGTRYDKLQMIEKKVLEQVAEAKEKGLIQNADLQQWAHSANTEVGLAGFKATPSWLRRFKKEYGELLGRGAHSRDAKIRQIDEMMLVKLEEAKEKGVIVKDKDIQRWGHAANVEVGLTQFNASTSWVLSFKRRNGIPTRISSRTPIRIPSAPVPENFNFLPPSRSPTPS